MDSISRLNGLMEVLRRQIADSARRLESTGKPGSSATPPSSPAAATGVSVQQLRRQIADRLRAIEQADPRRGDKARRVFFESVLLWEFGDALLRDRRIDDVLDHIDTAFHSSPELDRQLGELLTAIAGESLQP